MRKRKKSTIAEIKIPVRKSSEVNEIYVNVQREVNKVARGKITRVENRELVSAFLASAYVGSSTKVERIKDIVDAWMRVYYEAQITDEAEVVGGILTSGRIKDLDAKHMIAAESINDLIKKIKVLIDI